MLDCGHSPTPGAGPGTGYGEDADGRTYCYACCADRDREDMRRTGRAVLYWDGSKVSDWPGTLVFHPYAVRTGKHNIARTREDVWFIGPDMEIWHGVQYGQNTQLLHCRRSKGR